MRADRLCGLLGDLPLAINLAAGYLFAYGEPLKGYLPLLERVVEIDERVGLPDLEQDRRVLERVRGKLGP